MFTGSEITEILSELGITDVVWLPDSEMGKWESSLESADELRLIRVCREGEAWAVAAGLLLGGQTPVVMIQTTGLFESSDSMRNVLFDLHLPIFAIVGARSWLMPDSNDSAKTFTEPFLKSWQIDYRLIEAVEQKPMLANHFRHCQEKNQPGLVLIAESSI